MNVPDAAKPFEEALNVSFPRLVREAAQVHATATHFGRDLQKKGVVYSLQLNSKGNVAKLTLLFNEKRLTNDKQEGQSFDTRV